MTTHPPFRKQNDESAQSLVEFAISAILLLTLLAGAVDFGIALYSYVAIRDAAQEGTLYASMEPLDTAGIRRRVRTASDSPVDLSALSDDQIQIEVLPSGAQPCEGDGARVHVDVEYDYKLSMPLLPDILGVDEIHLTASATNAILQPACVSP